MDSYAYLARIAYDGTFEPTVATLRALHRRHLLSVPFENLDIHRGREIVLDPEWTVEKVVTQNRGGFCYELNSAFAALLRAAGFSVTYLSARVSNAKGRLSPEFDHLALRVDLEEPWLADVGFGDNFLEPLRLVDGIEQPDPAGTFRLVETSDRWRLERRPAGSDWRPQYDFSLHPRGLSEFADRCRYHQTSPESHFMRNEICSLATPAGRITLADRRLIITSNGSKKERELTSEGEWHSVLRGRFGIVLDEAGTESTGTEAEFAVS